MEQIRKAQKDICERGIDLSIGADYVDFGPGIFYLTESFDRARIVYCKIKM